MDQPKAPVYDHLQSLRQLGYVHNTPDGYEVSFEFLLIGDRRRNKTDVFGHARYELDELAAETGEHASLLIEENGVGRTLYTVQGESSIDFKVYDGTQTHLGGTAPGRTISRTSQGSAPTPSLMNTASLTNARRDREDSSNHSKKFRSEVSKSMNSRRFTG